MYPSVEEEALETTGSCGCAASSDSVLGDLFQL